MAFKKVLNVNDAEMFKFEKVKQSFTGYYIMSHECVVKRRPAVKHIFQTANGFVFIFGTYQITQGLQQVEPGTMTRITWVGEKELDSGVMKLFDIEFDSENVLSELPTARVNTAPKAEASTTKSNRKVEIEDAAEVDADGAEAGDDSLDYDGDDGDLDAGPLDEVPAARPVAPAKRPQAPTATQQRSVEGLLSKHRRTA